MSAQIHEAPGPVLRPAGDWRESAACTATDPELFFPTAVSGRALANQEAAAKTVCRRCPVLAECRQWAIAQLAHGVAGGLTEKERQSARSTGASAEKATAPIHATRREQAAAGRAAAHIARTTADGSHGCNRAPVLISHSNTQAGTAMEGHRG